jgi:hypothetical protein
MSDVIVSPLKRCTKCNQEYPATTEFFCKERGSLTAQCKVCNRIRNRQYRQAHLEEIREHNLQYYYANLEERRARNLQCYYAHADKRREYSRRYQHDNLEKIRERQRRCRQANPKKYRRVNTEKQREYKRRHRQIKPEIYKIAEHRRRARKHNLPDTFTNTDWQHALDCFGGCCAVCGRAKGLWHTIAADHWIPLTSPDCPGTVPTNIVPLCHSRKGDTDGCNNSKNNRDAWEWLVERYGARKAKRIIAKIQAYFAGLKTPPFGGGE